MCSTTMTGAREARAQCPTTGARYFGPENGDTVTLGADGTLATTMNRIGGMAFEHMLKYKGRTGPASFVFVTVSRSNGISPPSLPKEETREYPVYIDGDSATVSFDGPYKLLLARRSGTPLLRMVSRPAWAVRCPER